MMHVHRRDLVRLIYSDRISPEYGPALRRLCTIAADSRDDFQSPQDFLEAPMPGFRKISSGSYWKDQVMLFQRKAEYIFRTLGSWSAEYFVLESIKTLKKLSDENHEVLFWTRDERSHLLALLGQDEQFGRLERERDGLDFVISDKVTALLSFIRAQELSGSKTLIFVEQRITASILSTLLCTHPSVLGRFRCAPFVGLSNSSSRKYRMPELLDLKIQSQALADFRASSK